jgi:hypothetical protein
MNIQKIIGFLLLIAGVSLCAASSARLTQPVSDKFALDTRAKFANGAAAEATESAPDTPNAQAATAAAVQATATAKAAPIIQPKDRLNQWLSSFGALFGVGLALVISGAVIYRRVVRAEADTQPTGEAASTTIQIPKDFGHMLQTLAESVTHILSTHPLTDHLAAADAQTIKLAIETIQNDLLERLTDAPVRARVQLRYGVEGLAAVFSPLSSGERRVNRAWSALMDQHWPEAHASLSEAHSQFLAASSALQHLNPRSV